ncbi:hypothetical protein CYMTET_35637 [Cymbomonas tetramitiformis]|uniref:Uncharacterized protein n=1 Tax=Cymbomonas tetramitiformis TaxID=36881 RepID=A0AAE0F8V8_9CHLO|nr:hypothetical protein CYMTET_35637 [Cymbomonas tetramitiformis]|eukprot:gene39-59_t
MSLAAHANAQWLETDVLRFATLRTLTSLRQTCRAFRDSESVRRRIVISTFARKLVVKSLKMHKMIECTQNRSQWTLRCLLIDDSLYAYASRDISVRFALRFITDPVADALAVRRELGKSAYDMWTLRLCLGGVPNAFEFSMCEHFSGRIECLQPRSTLNAAEASKITRQQFYAYATSLFEHRARRFQNLRSAVVRFQPMLHSETCARDCNASLLRAIVADSRLRCLAFENVSPRELAIESLADCNLASLRLHFSGESETDLTKLVETASALTKLTDLQLRTEATFSNTACLSKMTALKRLLLETNMYRSTSVERVRIPGTLVRLACLTLIGFTELDSASLADLPALTELRLVNCRHSAHSHHSFRLPGHPPLCLERYHIEHLEFGSWNFNLSGACMPCLSCIRDLTIDMVGTFEDKNGDVLRRAVGLQRLCLANMYELSHLGFLEDIPSLEELVLRNLADLRNVQGLTKTPVLKFLHVSGNILADDSFLLHVRAARALRTLSIVGLNELAAISVMNTADRLPGLERIIVTDEQAKIHRRCCERRKAPNSTLDTIVLCSVDASP